MILERQRGFVEPLTETAIMTCRVKMEFIMIIFSVGELLHWNLLKAGSKFFLHNDFSYQIFHKSEFYLANNK